MGNTVSDSSRRFRRTVDQMLDELEAQHVESIKLFLGGHPHHILCKETSYSLFVRLAQTGDKDLLEFALSLTRKAVHATKPRDHLHMRILHARLQSIFGPPLVDTTLPVRLFTHCAEGALRPLPLVSFVGPRPRRNLTTPLLAAAEHGHSHVVGWMVELGVDILSTESNTGFSVLHAACKGNAPDLLEEILTWDLEVDTPAGHMPLNVSIHQPLGNEASCKCELCYSFNPYSHKL